MLGCEYGGGVTCHGGKARAQSRRSWGGCSTTGSGWHKDMYRHHAWRRQDEQPGPLSDAAAADQWGGCRLRARLTSRRIPATRPTCGTARVTFQCMPKQYITWWAEAGYRHSDIPYWRAGAASRLRAATTALRGLRLHRAAPRPGPATSRRRTRPAAAARAASGSRIFAIARPPSAPA